MSRIPLLVDGRAFSLQTKGGVSQIWTRILKSPVFLDRFDIGILLYPKFDDNIHLKDSGLLADPDIRLFHSPIPPTDNMNYGKDEHREQRRQAILSEAGAWLPRIVLNTYYGENVFPACARYAVVVHDFAHEDTEALAVRRTTPHVLSLKQGAMDSATDLIYISGSTRSRAQALYPALVSGKRSAVIYHGQDNAYPTRRIAGKFVHIGNRGLYKDFQTVAVAFRSFLARRPEAELSIVGGEAKDAPVEELIAQFPNQVRFATNVSDETVMAELSSASAFISASHYEGFGIPVLNALHVGTIPILADTPVYREISQHFALFFPPGDAVALEAQLEASLKPAAGQTPNAIRSWETVAREYTDFLRHGVVNA